MVPEQKYDRPDSIPSLAARLASLGYWVVPIPKGSKGPVLAGWDKMRLTPSDCQVVFSEDNLVGMLHVNNVMFDVDVTDPELSARICEEARARFPGALERVGRAPKSAFLLRMEEPGFTVQNTTRAEKISPDGEVFTAQVEVRSKTRQAVVYGIHPETQKPYKWVNGPELWATPLEELPLAKEGEIASFRDWAQTEINRWAGHTENKVIDLGLWGRDGFTNQKPSEQQFIAALQHIPASLGHEAGWCATLMAIHDYYNGSATGLEVAKQWSSFDPRYTPREVEVKWRSFETGKGVSYKSVFALARQHGADLAELGRMDRPKITTQTNAQAEPQKAFDHAPATAEAAGQAAWKIQRADMFTADFVAPEYIVDGVIRRGMVYTLTAPTGSGKTAVMLYAATAIATGMQFAGQEVEHGDVLFMAGENPDDVRARVIAALEFYGIDAAKCNLHFIAGTFSIRADMDRLREEAEKLPNLVMVVIDTFAAYFDGDDENSNAQALDFARLTRKIAAFPSKPAIVMPAHPIKNATRQNLTPKGGSSLLNEVDGNLTLWNDSGILTMHWQGKYRGAEFEPLQFELEKYQCDRLKDSKGRLMPTILAKPMLQMRATQIARETLSFEDKILLSISDEPGLSIAERCLTVDLRLADGAPHKSKMDRLLKRLSEQKLIRRFRTNWELTKNGERAVEMILNGGKFSPDLEV